MISFTSVLHSELAELKAQHAALSKQALLRGCFSFGLCLGFWEDFNSTLYLRHTAAIGHHPPGNLAAQSKRAKPHPKSSNSSDLLWGSLSTSVSSITQDQAQRLSPSVSSHTSISLTYPPFHAT